MMAKKIESRGKQCWGEACFFIVSPGLVFPPVHESLNKRALHVSGSMTSRASGHFPYDFKPR